MWSGDIPARGSATAAMATHTDFRGHTTPYVYESAGNVTDINRPGALNTHVTYDPRGNGGRNGDRGRPGEDDALPLRHCYGCS
jgi:YD repeat-containing protein